MKQYKQKLILGATAVLIGLLTQACSQKVSSTAPIHYLNGTLSTSSADAYSKYFGSNLNQSALDSSSNPLNSGTVTAWSSGTTMTVDIFTTGGQWGEVSLQMASTTTSVTQNGFTAWGACEDSGCDTYVLLLQANSLGVSPAPQVAITLVKSSSAGTDSWNYALSESSSSGISSGPIWI